MSGISNEFDVSVLTARNKVNILKAVNLILDEYAFAENNVVRIGFGTFKKADEFSRLHFLLMKYSLVGEIEHKFSQSESVALYFSVDHAGLLKLKDLLIQDFSSSGTSQSSQSVGSARKAKINFNASSKTIRLTYNGTTKNVHRFRNKQSSNYVVFNHLYLSPDTPLTKQEMGVGSMRSDLKDIPKTMGFGGLLKHIFFTIDKLNRTLTLHTNKTVSTEEAEILSKYVNKET